MDSYAGLFVPGQFRFPLHDGAIYTSGPASSQEHCLSTIVECATPIARELRGKTVQESKIMKFALWVLARISPYFVGDAVCRLCVPPVPHVTALLRPVVARRDGRILELR